LTFKIKEEKEGEKRRRYRRLEKISLELERGK
jgi:hypothetical protein